MSGSKFGSQASVRLAPLIAVEETSKARLAQVAHRSHDPSAERPAPWPAGSGHREQNSFGLDLDLVDVACRENPFLLKCHHGSCARPLRQMRMEKGPIMLRGSGRKTVVSGSSHANLGPRLPGSSAHFGRGTGCGAACHHHRWLRLPRPTTEECRPRRQWIPVGVSGTRAGFEALAVPEDLPRGVITPRAHTH